MFDTFLRLYAAAVEITLQLASPHINPLHARRAIAHFLGGQPALIVTALHRAGFTLHDFRRGAAIRVPFIYDFEMQPNCRCIDWLCFDADVMWPIFRATLRT